MHRVGPLRSCQLDQDGNSSLLRGGTDATCFHHKNTTSILLHHVVIVNLSNRGESRPPSVPSIETVGGHVLVVDVSVGRRLPADSAWRGSERLTNLRISIPGTDAYELLCGLSTTYDNRRYNQVTQRLCGGVLQSPLRPSIPHLERTWKEKEAKDEVRQPCRS